MKPPRLLRCADRLLLLMLSMVFIAQLAGCGGGTTLASGGIVGTGVLDLAQQGTITAVGNHTIVVNGQTIATTGATVMINGQPAADTALMVGMVVTIITSSPSNAPGTATSIEYHAEVKGVVSGVDTSAQTFTVLGQRVGTDPLTIFDGGTFATLLGQTVEVSGFRSTPGDLLATLVIIRSTVPTAPLEVTGVVSALDPVAHTFAIGLQLCDYSGLAAVSVPGNLANGATARVDGTQVSPGGTLFASSIAVLAPSLPDAAQAEVEGLITAFNGLGSFQVNGQLTDGRSAVIEGATADMLGNGVRVNVEGKLAGGVLVASKIEVEGQTVVAIDGTAQAVDPSGGTVTVGGQVVAVTPRTQFIDSSTAAVRGFSLAAVQVGDRLSILAYHNNGALVATRIERLNPDAPPPNQQPASIQGTITAFVSIANFVVAGQEVNAGSATFVGGTATNLANGIQVKVDGTLLNGTLNASNVTFLSGNPGPESVTVTGAISSFVSISSFTVARQLVDASSASFSNGNATDLANGRNVTVSGVIRVGTLVARSLLFTSPPQTTTLQVEGLIGSFVSIANFVVDGQAVNAAQATISNGTASDLVNGRKVLVTGTLQNGVLMATTVKVEDSQQATSVEGLITNFVSVSNFTVAGQVIDATNAKFDSGTAADLANGKGVNVQGLLVGGVLQAQEVEFQDD